MTVIHNFHDAMDAAREQCKARTPNGGTWTDSMAVRLVAPASGGYTVSLPTFEEFEQLRETYGRLVDWSSGQFPAEDDVPDEIVEAVSDAVDAASVLELELGDIEAPIVAAHLASSPKFAKHFLRRHGSTDPIMAEIARESFATDMNLGEGEFVPVTAVPLDAVRRIIEHHIEAPHYRDEGTAQ